MANTRKTMTITSTDLDGAQKFLRFLIRKLKVENEKKFFKDINTQNMSILEYSAHIEKLASEVGKILKTKGLTIDELIRADEVYELDFSNPAYSLIYHNAFNKIFNTDFTFTSEYEQWKKLKVEAEAETETDERKLKEVINNFFEDTPFSNIEAYPAAFEQAKIFFLRLKFLQLNDEQLEQIYQAFHFYLSDPSQENSERCNLLIEKFDSRIKEAVKNLKVELDNMASTLNEEFAVRTSSDPFFLKADYYEKKAVEGQKHPPKAAAPKASSSNSTLQSLIDGILSAIGLFIVSLPPIDVIAGRIFENIRKQEEREKVKDLFNIMSCSIWFRRITSVAVLIICAFAFAGSFALPGITPIVALSAGAILQACGISLGYAVGVRFITGCLGGLVDFLRFKYLDDSGVANKLKFTFLKTTLSLSIFGEFGAEYLSIISEKVRLWLYKDPNPKQSSVAFSSSLSTTSDTTPLKKSSTRKITSMPIQGEAISNESKKIKESSALKTTYREPFHSKSEAVVVRGVSKTPKSSK